MIVFAELRHGFPRRLPFACGDLLCHSIRKQGQERHAKRAGQKNQFRIRHQSNPRFDPCDDVPANIPAEPLAFRRQSGLRQSLFSAETPDLRTNQVAIASVIVAAVMFWKDLKPGDLKNKSE